MDGPGTYSQPPYAGGSKDESGTAAKDTISIGSGDRVSGEDRMGMEVHTRLSNMVILKGSVVEDILLISQRNLWQA
jgi:hypothetical protein